MTWYTASEPSSPISLGLASSFNLDAVRTVGRVSAYEAADDA
ncbi:beta-glucosidase [Salmonella enterica subsp. enterica]|nr:beta-glucosidase [Salmonella enterica subsp. enterica]